VLLAANEERRGRGAAAIRKLEIYASKGSYISVDGASVKKVTHTLPASIELRDHCPRTWISKEGKFPN